MRKLFVFLVGIIVIAVIIFLAMPLGIGFWMKSHYQQLLNSFNKSPTISIKVLNFERGWFTSKATLQLTIKTYHLHKSQEAVLANSGLNKPIQFTMQQRIQNGPFIFGNNKILWAKALVHTTNNNRGDRFNATTIIHFGNIIDNIFSTKSITLTSGQKRVVIKNASSHIIFVPKTQHMTSQTSISSMTLFEKNNTAIPEANTKKLELSNVALNSDIKYIKPLWYGNRSISVDKSTYFLSKKEPLTINHIIISSKQSQVNSTTASTLTAHANSITNNRINLTPFDLKFSITGVDTASLDALIKASTQLGQSTQINSEQLKKLFPFSLTLLSKGFTATLHYLKFGTPEGLVNATAHFTLPKQAGTSNPLALLQNTNANFNLTMPSAWLEKQLTNFYQNNGVNPVGNNSSASAIAAKQMQEWINNKKLIQDGPNVKITLTYKNGELLINGLAPSYKATPKAPQQ